MASPILDGTDALGLPEALGEVAERGEAQDLRDLRNAVVRLLEQEAALLDAPGDEVADGGGLKLLPEGVGEVVLVHVHHVRQLVQGQVLLEMVVNIPPHPLTVPAGPGPGRGGAQGEVLPPPQAQEDHVQ